MRPLISVVIPSYNQTKTISKCIESILNQKTKIPYEIIVADSSDNETRHILKKYTPKIKLICLKKRHYPGEARNAGIKKAKGNIIAFIDSDCIANKQWLEKIYQTHKKHEVLTGRVLNANPGKIKGWILYLMEFSAFMKRKDGIASMFIGCNMSVKKEIFEKYGGFITTWLGEDTELSFRIEKPIFYSSKAIVKHINKTNLKQILKHAYDIGLSSARERKGLPGSFLFKHKYLLPFLWIYRYFNIGFRTLSSWYFLMFLITSPLLILGLISWNIGFIKEAN